MFLEAVFGAIADSGAPLRILDLCAAPGGKTTLLSSLAGPESLIVANEPVRARATVLSDNVRRWGIGNVVVTSADPARFAPFGHYFDLILVDAPCSGEGMFRKDRESRRQWSESGAELCAARQRRILGEAWDALRPGGALIYSTCTFNPAENEQNVRWLASQYDCEGTIDVGTAPEWGIERGETDGIGTFRFYPHRTRGEGFFAAVVRKADGRRPNCRNRRCGRSRVGWDSPNSCASQRSTTRFTVITDALSQPSGKSRRICPSSARAFGWVSFSEAG